MLRWNPGLLHARPAHCQVTEPQPHTSVSISMRDKTVGTLGRTFSSHRGQPWYHAGSMFCGECRTGSCHWVSLVFSALEFLLARNSPTLATLPNTLLSPDCFFSCWFLELWTHRDKGSGVRSWDLTHEGEPRSWAW